MKSEVVVEIVCTVRNSELNSTSEKLISSSPVCRGFLAEEEAQQRVSQYLVIQ